MSGLSRSTHGAFVSRMPWFQAGERNTFVGFSISRAQGWAATARVWEPSCEALSITRTSSLDVATVRFEGGEASLEVVPGVEVHDDDGQLGRPGIGGHECGVCATSTMPVMMKNTPAHRSVGICSCRMNLSASRISTYDSEANG